MDTKEDFSISHCHSLAHIVVDLTTFNAPFNSLHLVYGFNASEWSSRKAGNLR